MKLKLAIITPGFKPVPAVKGGAVEQLIEYFIEANEVYKKYDIDLFTIDDPKLANISYKYTNLIKISDQPPKSIKIIYQMFTKFRKEISKFNKKYRIYSFYIDQVKKKFKTNYYDCVLVENIMDNYLSISDKITNEKIYFHLHNELENSTSSMITAKKAKEILKTVDKFIVVSKFLKRQIEEVDKNNSNKVVVVHNGILKKQLVYTSQSELIKIRDKYNLKRDDIVVTYVGTLSKAKGVDKFIEAAKRLEGNTKIKFLICGDLSDDSNPYIKKLKKYAHSSSNKNITFLGYIDNNEISRIYSVSDCIVIPTQIEETFGVVALEAITMGVPVIASISGGLPEVLSKKCALFVKRDDHYLDNLCDAIIKISQSSDLRKNMSKAGLKRSKIFPQDKKDYFNLIDKVIRN